MQTVQISVGPYVAIIDAEDAQGVQAYTWLPLRSNGRIYAQVWTGGGRKHRRKLDLHRFVMDAPQGICVDHINGDPLDNRKANLRLCTKAQNTWNRGPSRANKWGLKGVSLCARSKKYRATICAQGQKRELGLFADAQDAALAYNQAARELHGEFAYQNPIPKQISPHQCK